MKSSLLKRISLLLALLSVSSTVAACGGDTPATDDTTASGGNDTTTTPIETEDSRLAIDDGLPDVDLEGYKFRILPCYPWGIQGAVSLYAPETDTGEVVDSAALSATARSRSASTARSYSLTTVQDVHTTSTRVM